MNMIKNYLSRDYITFSVAIDGRQILEELQFRNEGQSRQILEILKECLGPNDDSECFFVRRASESGKDKGILLNEEENARLQKYESQIRQIVQSSFGPHGGDFKIILETLFERIRRKLPAPVPTVYMPTFRRFGTQINEYKEEYGDENNRVLIDELAALERPRLNQRQDKERFLDLQEFVRNVTEDPSIEIEIPHDRETVYISTNGNIYPLESLGTGIF